MGEAPRADGERKRRRRRRRGGRGGSGEARPEAALAGVAVADSLLDADGEDEEVEELVGAESPEGPADTDVSARLADTQPLPILSSPAGNLEPDTPESSFEWSAAAIAVPEAAADAAPAWVAGESPPLPASPGLVTASTAAAPPVATPALTEAPAQELRKAAVPEVDESRPEVPAPAATDAAAESGLEAETRAPADGAGTADGEGAEVGAPPAKPTYTVWSSSD